MNCDLSDTKDGLRCWRIGIYILWLTSSLCRKISGEISRAHRPSCFYVLRHQSNLANSKSTGTKIYFELSAVENMHCVLKRILCLSRNHAWIQSGPPPLNWPIVCPLKVVFGSSLPSSIKIKLVRVGPPLTKISGSAHGNNVHFDISEFELSRFYCMVFGLSNVLFLLFTFMFNNLHDQWTRV